MGEIQFYKDFDFEYAVMETVSPLVRRIVARNPGPFTGPGTGTYVIGQGNVAIIDPGPSMTSHVNALLHALRGETIDKILITHSHPDHYPAAAPVQQSSGAKVYGSWGDIALKDGDTVEGPGWHLTAVHTPGHTSDHLSYAFEEENILFSGDHVMGWSTSVILGGEGSLGDYMNSLDKVLRRVEAGDDKLFLPTHGAAVTDPRTHVRAFIEHRNERTAAILARLRQGEASVSQLVSAVYIGLAPSLHWGASASLGAHLDHLMEEDIVGQSGGRYFLKKR
jgi:glyoxylase-like metal-dependent hydrolase (beta-lactamase superfamily II)